MPWVSAVSTAAERLEEDWIAMRRYLHQHPELSGCEQRTTEFLADALNLLELTPRITAEGRGVTADFVSSPELADHQRLAIRGDIDALPITDHKAVEYRSLKDGVMHACGHDVHATAVYGGLQILMEMQRARELPWPIATRAIFQPAEETATGARYMIHQHALRDVEAIIALHVDPTRSVGCIGLRAGILTAACDMIHVTFRGRGGHGARPHLCTDPIDACTRWVQSAYRRVARTVNAHQTVVLSVGQLGAGHSPNVIPELAELKGTLRSLEPEGRRTALETLDAVCDAVAQETGCAVELKLGVSAPAVVNDGRLVQLLREAAVLVVDPAAPDPIEEPSMGSEDFSYYLEQVPGAMFRLGVAGKQVGHEPLHTSAFDVDERAIAVGAKLFAATVIQYFNPART